MLYLIGGAPRCGKTILTEKIAKQKNIPYLSVDAFRAGLIPYFSQDEITKKLPDQYLRLETNTAEELLASEIIESKTLWLGIRGIIEYLILCKQEYIIEGVALMPEHIHELLKTHDASHIRIIYLVKTDKEKIKDGLINNTSKHDWLKDLLQHEEFIEKAVNMIHMKSTYIQEQAKRFDFTVIDTSEHFTEKIQELSQGF